MSYYFVRVPILPKEISHQRGTVELVEYSVKERQKVEKGQTIAVVENWWARMALKAVEPGFVTKTFFERGTSINEGDPFAIIECDPENGPKSKDTCQLEILEHIRQKPLNKSGL